MAKFCRDTRGRRLYVPEWMDFLGWSQVRMAAAIDITPTYLNELLKGKKVFSTLYRAKDIADQLGITLDDLYSPPPPPEETSRWAGLSVQARDAAIKKTRA